jgi:hypothetical protein
MRKEEYYFDESLHIGNLVVAENHGYQWPHKAQIVDIDMENKFALNKLEMTQNIDYGYLEALKRFSMNDSAPRKQKSTGFYTPPSGKKMH